MAWRPRTFLLRIPLTLALIVSAGALQSLAWDMALPAFQGPDEDSQFAYVQHLAETGHLPSPSVGNSPNSFEAGNALLQLNLFPLRGDLHARPAWSSADLGFWHGVERSLPRGSRATGAGPNPIAKNPPLYYAGMSLPYRLVVWLPLLKRLFVLRLFNALCFLATIVFTWLLAGDLFGRVRWKQAVAAGVVALEPQLAFMSAVINADNLLIALTTAFLWACLRLVMRGPSMGRVLAASGLASAAILTHGRGLVTLPVLFVALLTAWIRHRPALRETLIRAAAAAGTVGVAALAYVLAGGGGGSLYGGQLHTVNSGSFNLRQFISSIYQFYFARLPGMRRRIGPAYGYPQVFIDTFYGTFGWLEVAFRPRVYDLLQVFSALGLVGFYTACVVRWRALMRSWPGVVVMLSLLLTLVVFLHYVSYRALIGDQGMDPLITGRYLLPMVSLFGLAIAFTVGSLPRRAGPLVGAVVLSAGVILALGGIGITAARFYA
jgi:4-amino-4-deoxy-L-arabinose transferase-like glycosyltransferase